VLRSPSSLSSLLSSSPPPASGVICASAEIPVLRLAPLRNRDSGVRYGGTGTGTGTLLSPSSGLPLGLSSLLALVSLTYLLLVLRSLLAPVSPSSGAPDSNPWRNRLAGPVIPSSLLALVLRLTPLRNRDSEPEVGRWPSPTMKLLRSTATRSDGCAGWPEMTMRMTSGRMLQRSLAIAVSIPSMSVMNNKSVVRKVKGRTQCQALSSFYFCRLVRFRETFQNRER